MIKRNIAVLCLATAAFAGCKSSGADGNYIVSGKFSSVQFAGKPIYLTELNYIRNEEIHVDTATIRPDGMFSFKAHPVDLRIFQLSVDGKEPLMLVNDERQVQVNVMDSELVHAAIKSSEASKRLRDFIKSLGPLSDTAAVEKTELQKKFNTYIDEANEPASIYYILNNQAALVLGANDMLALSQRSLGRFKTDAALAYLANSFKSAVSDNKYALLNKPAPDLRMRSLENQPMKISDFRGKYVLVDFWASWCGPCRAENPNVVKVYNKYKDKNFTILGVSLDQNKSLWAAAVQKDGLEWNHMSDLKQWGSAAVKTYNIKGIPFNVLIDPEGKIIANNLRGEALERKMKDLLGDR